MSPGSMSRQCRGPTAAPLPPEHTMPHGAKKQVLPAKYQSKRTEVPLSHLTCNKL